MIHTTIEVSLVHLTPEMIYLTLERMSVVELAMLARVSRRFCRLVDNYCVRALATHMKIHMIANIMNHITRCPGDHLFLHKFVQEALSIRDEFLNQLLHLHEMKKQKNQGVIFADEGTKVVSFVFLDFKKWPDKLTSFDLTFDSLKHMVTYFVISWYIKDNFQHFSSSGNTNDRSITPFFSVFEEWHRLIQNATDEGRLLPILAPKEFITSIFDEASRWFEREQSDN